MSHDSQSRRAGFTLIELLVVIAIIGLLISLILVAAADGVRRAEERATQSLITKLETALNDRLDALLNAQAPINQTHRFLAAINSTQGGSVLPVGSSSSNSDDRRAQVIAQTDYIKAELPDVFFINFAFSNTYPLNFAAAPYPSGQTGVSNYVLPLGNNSVGLPLTLVNGTPTLTIPSPQLPTTGMFGASFSAAGGAYKSLYTSAANDLMNKLLPNGQPANAGCSVNITPGFDGVDNNNDGLIDELVSPTASTNEVIVTGSPDLTFATYVANRLARHTHKTARAEMLYAILVEGLSPLGSSFSREDFTSREVQDTDGDGLPEFIDAWGEPLQFYRWPIYYGSPGNTSQPNPITSILGTSDSQRGYLSYGGPMEAREQDPLDPNQLLVSPGWWSNLANPSLTLGATTFSAPNGNPSYPNGPGPGSIAFMNYFHSLVDPNPTTVSSGAGWDRGGGFTRREYFSKFLILSGGPDHQPGTAQFNLEYSDWTGTGSNKFIFPDSSQSTELNALWLNYIENQAAVSDPSLSVRSGSFWEIPDPGNTDTTKYLKSTANADDITNHNISGISTGVR